MSDTAGIFGSPAPPENLQKHICGSMTTFAKTVLDCLSSAVKQHVQDGGLAAVLGWMTTFHASSPGEQNRYIAVPCVDVFSRSQSFLNLVSRS